MVENEVLTREKALPENVLPTGRKVGVVHSKGIGMYEIRYVDGKAGDLPDSVRGRYTGITYAEHDMQRYVRSMWDVSDRASSKPKKTLTLDHNAAV